MVRKRRHGKAPLILKFQVFGKKKRLLVTTVGGWYFNSFEISDPNQKLALVFNGVDDDAEVYINGKWFGAHKGYSEGFHFDVSSKLKKGVNTIAVLVNDYSGGGGIYKPVFIRSYQNEEDLLITPFAKMQSLASPKWVKEGIIYEIYVRSFSKEGNFKGVTKRLDELKGPGSYYFVAYAHLSCRSVK